MIPPTLSRRTVKDARRQGHKKHFNNVPMSSCTPYGLHYWGVGG
jgi:hypothetical protein